jgi:hypothetical protein
MGLGVPVLSACLETPCDSDQGSFTSSQSSKIYENKSFKPDWKIVPFDKGVARETELLRG